MSRRVFRAPDMLWHSGVSPTCMPKSGKKTGFALPKTGLYGLLSCAAFGDAHAVFKARAGVEDEIIA